MNPNMHLENKWVNLFHADILEVDLYSLDLASLKVNLSLCV